MEIKVGEQAMFKNLKQNWVKGEYVANVEDSFVYLIKRKTPSLLSKGM